VEVEVEEGSVCNASLRCPRLTCKIFPSSLTLGKVLSKVVNARQGKAKERWARRTGRARSEMGSDMLQERGVGAGQ
jgi:hypothetical protein